MKVDGLSNIFMNNDLGGLIFNGQKRPNRVKGVKPDSQATMASSIRSP